MSTESVQRTTAPLNAVVAIEDSMTAPILLKTLKIAGFGCVFIVHSYREILAELEQAFEPIDLLISDLQLQGGDVYQLIPELANSGFRGAMMFLSAERQVHLDCAIDLAEASGLRVAGTMTYPLSVHGMLEALQRQSFRTSHKAPREAESVGHDTLSRDLHDWRIEAVYQPKVSLLTGAVVGFEALARWNHPRYGMLGPAQFMDLVEQAALIDELTSEMLQQSLDMLHEVTRIVPRAKMAVNLSGPSFVDPLLPDRLLELVRRTKTRPSQIVFEITETRMVRSGSDAAAGIDRLGLMGFGIALDDFGTGFSSLERLAAMPITELKVDRRFCHGASQRPQLRHILKSCLGLARKLGLETVAEGIEETADLELVRTMGYDVVQGYWVSRPLRARDVLSWTERSGFDQLPRELAA